MNQELILGILYELSMILGGEVRARPLTERFLQRLLFHTGFPCGLYLRDIDALAETGRVRAQLDTVIGDPALAGHCGQSLELPAALALGGAELNTDPAQLAACFGEASGWQSWLKLPIDERSAFLLLATRPVKTEAPLTSMFTPVLRNFARVRELCCENEAHMRKLERANREMEAFIYSVSHDLRAPLRAIFHYSDIVIKESLPRLESEQQDFLRRIRKGAEQMEMIIDDLLQLSRTTRATLTRETVDLSQQAETVLADLARREPARRVAFDIQPGIVAEANPELIGVALRNLLENAWKYTGREPAATIAFGSEILGGERVFFVRDNGVGFDMRYAEKLFMPFQRLHGEHEFPGTGIGLATVQRVIERHGGRIWAEAAPGQGAIFRFTLPADD